jgi:hypothetical protein
MGRNDIDKRVPVMRGTGVSGSHHRMRRLFEGLATHRRFEVELHPLLRPLDATSSARLSREPLPALKARLGRTFAFFEGALNGHPDMTNESADLNWTRKADRA